MNDGAKLTDNRVVSYVNLLNGEPSKKTVNFHSLVALAGNEADVAILLTLILEVNERFSNSVYRFFLGKREFSSKDGMDSMLENGLWLFRNVPLILKRWSPNANFSNDDLSNVPVWVKFHEFLLLRLEKMVECCCN
ncbi:putative reverse transcriptase domain-containing protein [Tanacetum coccineum]